MNQNSPLKANKINFKLSTPEEIGHELGFRLRQQRIQKRWTQQELADRSGLDVGTIKNLENKGQCALLNLIRVLFALDCVQDLSNLFQSKINSIKDMETKVVQRVRNAPRRLR